MHTLTRLALSTIFAAGCVSRNAQTRDALRPQSGALIVVHSYDSGLVGIHTANSAIKLHVGRDAEQFQESVLFVEYPAPSADPAGRDIQLAAESTDWSTGKAIAFRVKPERAIRLSISFIDRNHVVYTAWTNLQSNQWQPVRIALDAIRPNPYFQPPDATPDRPIDVSDVRAIAFAPQDPLAGSLAISAIVIMK